jgi:hypothetical protein
MTARKPQRLPNIEHNSCGSGCLVDLLLVKVFDVGLCGLY